MVRALILFCLTGILNTAYGNLLTDQPTPFAIRNQNPFIQIYGLPPMEPATITPSQHLHTQLIFDLANNSILNDSANESISLDGESYRLGLTFRRGLGDQREIGIEVPIVAHHNGMLDNFIEGWHRTFGLSNTERNKTPSNVLDYSYRRQGQELVAIRTNREGLGDIRLFAASGLYQASDQRREVTLRGSLKLPTGNSQRLMGSGSTDIALSVNGIDRNLSAQRITTYGQLGLLALSDSDILPTQQRHWVAFGGLGLNWHALASIDLKAQLDGHTPFYKSELAQLSASSLQLTVGGTIYTGRSTSLDLGVGENLFSDTTPDFLVNVTVSHRY
ncbi:MAG: DUF3187 family protein [Gammaproteobacteria bacterium]|nr:DUF3187 family protein [Gammaproteobacteria bacterium]